MERENPALSEGRPCRTSHRCGKPGGKPLGALRSQEDPAWLGLGLELEHRE